MAAAIEGEKGFYGWKNVCLLFFIYMSRWDLCLRFLRDFPYHD